MKTFSARRVNQKRQTQGAAVWQRNDYEQIIRGAGECERIARYIDNNPQRWQYDQLNPCPPLNLLNR